MPPQETEMDMENKTDRAPKRRTRAERSAAISKLVAKLPNRIDVPYYDRLLKRWPTPPTLSNPVSQLCTADQFDEPDYTRVCEAMAAKRIMLRKQWEFIYICRSLEQAGVLRPGARGLVFGVGRERLPSVFVARGCRITATDLPMEEANGEWAGGPQHSATIDNLRYPRIVDSKTFDANTEFRPVNMNHIPEDLQGYDFCWSSCALEHLGSLELGLEFIRNSLKCLKPGGVAAHTTEFNLGSNQWTLEDGPSVVYREQDLKKFEEEMVAAGHEMKLNLHPGDTPTDRLVDRDRNSDIHLRLYVRNEILATSVGLCIRKAT
jgi:hypothetical protein